MRVTAFAAQGDLAVDLVEVSSPVLKLGDALGRFTDDAGDDLGVAEPFAGGDGVGDVVLEVILGIDHPGDAALGVALLLSLTWSLVATRTR